jgi:hypothetical protein
MSVREKSFWPKERTVLEAKRSKPEVEALRPPVVATSSPLKVD